MSGSMGTDDKRYWWLPLIVIAATTGGLWLFQRAMFPASVGGVGLVVGFFLGAALVAVFEDYLDNRSD
jgi:hypothetical protein